MLEQTSSTADGAGVRVLGAGTSWADGLEDHVLSILRGARDRSSASDELAAEIRDWPTRYHFSRLRSKILSPLRIEPGMRVLDLGGGTGPLSRRLGELGAEVLLVDGSAVRAQAAAERCRDLENVSVAVGTVFDLDDDTAPFDVVLAVGVLEYAQSSPGGPVAMLRRAASLLGPDGVLAVAIENAIGLKYLLGYAEDHVGLPWVSWEGYTGIDHVRTYSRPELASLLAGAGLPEQAWFSPFPDYKLPTVILSDTGYEVGPEFVDSIVPQPCSPDASLPVLLCDARAAHRTMLRAGLGRDIANSFLVVAGRSSDAVDAHADRETLAWLTGSERRARFMRNRRVVLHDSAAAIVDDSSSREDADEGWLTQRRVSLVQFESGEPLDRLVSDALATGDADRTRELLTLWVQTLRGQAEVAAPDGASESSPFQAEDGRAALPGGHLDTQPANFVHRDGRLYRIDTEWEARGLLDFDLICIRGLFYFVVDLLTRGISISRAHGRDVASVLTALAEVGGVEDTKRAIARLPTAEGTLQALVRGVPVDRVRGDIDRLLKTPAEDLAARVAGPTVAAVRSELEAELDALRRAHEAQARLRVAERLALAEEVEREVETLREEIEWRKEVMEQLELIRNSRSLRYTEPLRRIAAVLRRH